MVSPIDSASGIFSSGFDGVLKYWWVLAILAVLGILAAVLWWAGKFKKKNTQWTHKLKVKIELPNGEIDPKESVFKMRRWKHKDEKTPPLFELEKPLIGSRIFVELEEYSGPTTYTVILGIDGRLYIPTKTIMCRDKNALEVSAKHAGIDRARQQYNARFEQMNATPSKIDALTLLKYGLWATALIVLLVLGITGIKAWGDRASYDASAATAQVRSWEVMEEVMIAAESLLNTQALLIPDLKELYGQNLQSAIKSQKLDLNQS